MPRPNAAQEQGANAIQKQVIEDYQKKIMKAKGNERIRTLLESYYFTQAAYDLPAYQDVLDNAVNYFLPRDKKGRLMVYGVRDKIAELSNYIDDEILPAFDEYRKKNPRHSDEWYKNSFPDTKAGSYQQLALNLMYFINMELSNYRTAFFGTENMDKYGKKWDPTSTTVGILIYEANKERRQKMSPEKAGILERAELGLEQGVGEKKKIKAISKEVITKNMTGDLDEWEEVDLETDEAYKARQTDFGQKEPKYDSKQSAPATWIQFYKGIDFSFIKDDAMKKSMNELHHDVKLFNRNRFHVLKADYEKNEKLFQQLDSFGEKLKKADHSYWINSGSYNDVKKGVQNLRKILVKGETPENRDDFLKAYKEIIDLCDTYERKNPGIRRQKTGNQRKSIIADLKEFAKQQISQLTINKFAEPQVEQLKERSSYSELKTKQVKERESIANSEIKTKRRNSTVLYKGQAKEQKKDQQVSMKKPL